MSGRGELLAGALALDGRVCVRLISSRRREAALVDIGRAARSAVASLGGDDTPSPEMCLQLLLASLAATGELEGGAPNDQ